MNLKTYLIKEKAPECIFVLEQKRKKYLTKKNNVNSVSSESGRNGSNNVNSIINSEHNKDKELDKHEDSRSIIFGTELLIKHSFSGYYLAVNLSKSNSSSSIRFLLFLD
jgi:hypothetical protein